MKLTWIACLLTSVAAIAAFASATDEKSYAEISFKELTDAIAAKKVALVDVNGSESFNKAHIPGALDFAAEKDLAAKLPKDKSALVVAYCGSPQCNAWSRGAAELTKLGYTNVKHFKGGISGWKEAGGATEAAAVAVAKAKTEATFADISFDELKTAVAKKNVFLVDVNGTESYSKGHIPGAIDFVVSEKDLAAKLPKDKNALIVAYCGGPQCNAWKRGADALAKLGYTNVKHFKGGISGWKDAGGAMEGASSNAQ